MTRHARRLAHALERLLAAYGYPNEPKLFAACERAARNAKRALAGYYRETRQRGIRP